jgi:hypothetical protein
MQIENKLSGDLSKTAGIVVAAFWIATLENSGRHRPTRSWQREDFIHRNGYMGVSTGLLWPEPGKRSRHACEGRDMEVHEQLQSVNEKTLIRPASQVIHWYDFICPFCYVAQGRNRWWPSHGLELVELPFQAHPEVPHGGLPMGKRQGPMYERLEQEARLADLPLQWPSRLPNSRQALFAAEWIRRHDPSQFEQFQRAVFAAHFALGEDINDPSVIDRYAKAQDVDTEGL